MSNSYHLKSHPNKTLFEHLNAVAISTKAIIQETYPQISSGISISDLSYVGYVIGATHDVGKATAFFQKYLLDHKAEDPLLKSHSMISSLYCAWVVRNADHISPKYRDFLAIASSLAIQGHHGSLKRPISYLENLNEFHNKEILAKQINAFERLEELEKISKSLGIGNFREFTKQWEEIFFTFGKILIKSSKTLEAFHKFQEPYFLVNLLYSALLDADRMDVARVRPERAEVNSCAVDEYVKTFEKGVDDGINKYRKVLFDSLKNKSSNSRLNKKIFTLTAPTGLGKTLASMNLALYLRKRIQQEKGQTPRIIYVAPFISILDQTMKVLQDVFKNYDQTNILLMHHHLSSIQYIKNPLDEQKREEYSTSQSELLIQGWNSEIIVTTFIQFFNTICGRYTSQLRRLHNLAGSIVILDEVQSIPYEYWAAVGNILEYLVENFDLTIIMMTATQPLIFDKNKTEELTPSTIMSLPPRVEFHPQNEKGMKIADFCVEVNELIKQNPTKSILVEMNTISTANRVYSLLNSNNLLFLSSQIIPLHRKSRIEEIKNRLAGSEPLVVVSTQVVEAGVDIDFDMVVRDIGPIDSIVQAAGRCNRHGLRKASESPVYIYRLVDDNGSEYAKSVYGRVSIDIANSLIKKNADIVSMVNSYYNEIQRRRSNQTSMMITTAISELNYEDVTDKFELIGEDDKFPVFVEADDNASNMWKRFVDINDPMRTPKRDELIQIRNQMEQYMIGVSQKHVNILQLESINGIYKIDRGNIGIMYNETIGLVRS